MTSQQWECLLAVIEGESVDPAPVGFIIDSPWLPNWAGMSILDYYTHEGYWLDANLNVMNRFPEVIFLPGFWAEYGMCTEPSAFGAKCLWHENEFPFAERVLDSLDRVAGLACPNPRTDGLAPFVLKRLQHAESAIHASGHAIRFAVARGPLNIAGFLVGNTEFLMGMKMQPDAVHALLETITSFLVEWVQVQAEAFPSIQGVFLLDDLVGFCGKDDFMEFAVPYLKRVFNAIDARVRFFHNDAHGLVCAPFLREMGVNLFNFSYEHSLNEMRALAGNEVTFLGNLPPRDVLAQGTPDDVFAGVRAMLAPLEHTRRLILSCGGGMPPGVATENIEAFIAAAR
ncbi:MAG TPA: uroporphyrinogen decarboxylase family protein [Candidatus Hydrogenedentes bacterium]|nr:uroporphyrinogen decarboxylase family protein [Candidatus Hydrogenedentota bacterium]